MTDYLDYDPFRRDVQLDPYGSVLESTGHVIAIAHQDLNLSRDFEKANRLDITDQERFGSGRRSDLKFISEDLAAEKVVVVQKYELLCSISIILGVAQAK